MEIFRLRFSQDQVGHWASEYGGSQGASEKEQCIINVIAPRTRAAGHYTREDFLSVCKWKSGRRYRLCEENSEGQVMDVTHRALSADCPGYPLNVLSELRGVSWARASALLHFGHREPYPILDVRALWSAGVDVPTRASNYLAAYPAYRQQFIASVGPDGPRPTWYRLWDDYTAFCRDQAGEMGIDMRTLDRALFRYFGERIVSS